MIGAIDIGGTKIAVGMVDDSGRVLAKTESPTHGERGYADGLARMEKMLRETARQAGGHLRGIGIGSTGWVFPFTGEFGDVDFLPTWKGCNPVNDLSRAFNVSAALENDGDASALGEAAWGAARGKSRLIYVTVGTGIGGGIVLDGQLYRGVDRAHPEVGHHVIDASGPPCTCGFRGCWEALATGPAMAAWYHAQPGARTQSGQLTAKQIFEQARNGDALARQAVERETHYLALGLANLIGLFVPEVIVLGGSVMKSIQLNDLRQVIAQGCRFVPWQKTELALASLGEDANLIGAARVWHHRYNS
ncbi:MAG TPA: ROK family protein [Bryobacteraceae bacterium]|nr:ROK family protein [Bryobacteraceae bacterium]